MTVKIREKIRRCASPKDGLRQKWTEWQVVEGRKVLSRHDTEAQAQTALDKLQIEDLPARLRVQADNVERDGWVSAARLMREAAGRLEYLEDEIDEMHRAKDYNDET